MRIDVVGGEIVFLKNNPCGFCNDFGTRDAMSVALVRVISLVEVVLEDFDKGCLAGALRTHNIDISRLAVVIHPRFS